MRKGPRDRTLTEEERSLWERVADSAKPLRPSRRTGVKQPAPPSEEVMREPARAPQASRRNARVEPAPQGKAVGPLDRRTRTRLARGGLEVDARIDLHGLTQATAHQRLRRFLEQAQVDGARIVLVITGRGRPDDAGPFHGEGRGILRRAVPAWLESAEFRGLVGGIDEAGRRHGGEGALYVRLKRKRDGR